ncbi:HEAT repeat-containing protein [Paenibacillus sp. UNCCL117]|uniref:HEAT repeat domain-containing protein n=1 Tax=unclassified Paenibacillus TaxID=185978 RepID=UPI00088862C3|nr:MULTISPECIES: HEAT repeat domain-containing protein [unclassified Paenibacillus]SDD50108.1 HEAT repeat-containing protein [Paenibacillus sp. cl123]SFW49790.1 HEAT repeat-containing protein [Paenibacillus sp. UNCCL117]
MNDSTAMSAVLLFCMGCLGLLLALYGYLLIRKWLYNKRSDKMAAWTQRASMPDSPIERYVTTGEASRMIMPRHPWQWNALEAYLTHRLRVGGTQPERERVCRIAEEHFGPLYRRRLNHRKAEIRLRTLDHIGLFRMNMLHAEVFALLSDKKSTPEELWAVLRVMAALQDPKLPDCLLGAYVRLPLSSDHRYRQVLMAMGTELLEELIVQFDKGNDTLQRNLLDVLRTRHIRTEQYLALIERLMSSPTVELRIRALKAAASFGYLSQEAEEAHLVRYSEWRQYPWEERLMAARLMGEIRNPEYRALLEQMIGDDRYAVRVEAAQSIGRYPDGDAQLARIAAMHADRYAREAAEEMLERRSYERNVE